MRSPHAERRLDAMGRMSGQVAIVSGASRGLGRATALAFAREGAALTLCARGAGELMALVDELRGGGVEALGVVADLRQPRDIERLVALTFERFGRVDVLVNNASELGPTPLPHLADYPTASFDDVLRVNLVAPFRLTQAVIGDMLRRGSGVVLNVSSDVAVIGYPGWGAYSVSKAAIDALTRTWAAEIAGTGVRIHSIDPGDMDTAIHRAALPEDDPASLLDPAYSAEAFVRLALSDPGAERVRATEVLAPAG